jgi:hypothetical protein
VVFVGISNNNFASGFALQASWLGVGWLVGIFNYFLLTLKASLRAIAKQSLHTQIDKVNWTLTTGTWVKMGIFHILIQSFRLSIITKPGG